MMQLQILEIAGKLRSMEKSGVGSMQDSFGNVFWKMRGSIRNRNSLKRGDYETYGYVSKQEGASKH